MIELLLENPLAGLIAIAVLLVSLTSHEYAHGWMADRLGDPTARVMGRLSFNPISHLDLMGSIFLVFFGFGWAKPVPIDPYNFKNPKMDTLKVAIVGPLTNFALALIFTFMIKILTMYFGNQSILMIFNLALSYAVYINVTLAIFNLIPIAPLDGFKVVAGLLDGRQLSEWMSLERYGFIFLMFLIFPILGKSSVFGTIISPFIRFITSLLLG